MSFFDSLLDRIRAMFETTRAPKIAASNRLGASSVGELSGALDELPNGEQGWIGFDDYDRLFATKDVGPSEGDGAAGSALAEFAADHRCSPRREAAERRIYFSKRAFG
jgi:hypothetical protein